MKRMAGPFILLVALLVVGGYYSFGNKTATKNSSLTDIFQSSKTPAVTAKGFMGGEKSGLLADPEVQKKLQSKFGITVEARKKGSIEMVEEATEGQDFIWPSSPTALEIYKARNAPLLKSETVFNSPLVFYTWDIVCEALIKQGVVEKIGESYYVVDMPRFVKMINDGKQWKEVGLPDLYGNVTVFTTDPTRSMSGNLFAGLLANLFNSGKVVTDDTLNSVLPKVAKFFSELGYMEHSSGDLFSQFLKQGVGSYPMIVGYENQMIEFSIQNEQHIELLKKKVRTLYPKPTVWASHPFIAVTGNGIKLLEALQSPEIQQLAWERHGFRSGLIGVQNSTKALKVIGVPETIDSVMPLPQFTTMQKIIEKLNTGKTAR